MTFSIVVQTTMWNIVNAKELINHHTYIELSCYLIKTPLYYIENKGNISSFIIIYLPQNNDGPQTFNPLRLLYVLKRIKNKSCSYYSTFPNVPENTTRHKQHDHGMDTSLSMTSNLQDLHDTHFLH